MVQEITDLDVWEVSVVDKPANGKKFIAIKSKNGGSEMSINAEVIKKLLPGDISVEKVAELLSKHADPEGFDSVVAALEGQIEKMDTDARDAVGTLVESYLEKSKDEKLSDPEQKTETQKSEESESDILVEVRKAIEQILTNFQKGTSTEPETKPEEKPEGNVSKSGSPDDPIIKTLNAMEEVLTKIANQSMGKASINSDGNEKETVYKSRIGGSAITRHFE